MSDSDAETSSGSSAHDRMSVSDPEGDVSRDEDDMPSAEIDVSEGAIGPRNRVINSSSSNSSCSENLEDDPAVVEVVKESAMLKDVRLQTMDLDDAAMELMTGSYSEIFSPSRLKAEQEEAAAKTPVQILAAEGTVLKEGDMVHFIAKNLETKIRMSSPDVSESSHIAGSQSELQRPGSVALESTFLSLLEREARCIAASVDGLTEHLAVSLHTISAVTAQSLTVYKDSVCKTCDSMDANIKSMYQLMAKCEELGKAMAPIHKQAEQVKEIKKLLDILENLG